MKNLWFILTLLILLSLKVDLTSSQANTVIYANPESSIEINSGQNVLWGRQRILTGASYNSSGQFTITDSGNYQVEVNLNQQGLSSGTIFNLIAGIANANFSDKITISSVFLNAGETIYVQNNSGSTSKKVKSSSSIKVYLLVDSEVAKAKIPKQKVDSQTEVRLNPKVANQEFVKFHPSANAFSILKTDNYRIYAKVKASENSTIDLIYKNRLARLTENERKGVVSFNVHFKAGDTFYLANGGCSAADLESGSIVLALAELHPDHCNCHCEEFCQHEHHHHSHHHSSDIKN